MTTPQQKPADLAATLTKGQLRDVQTLMRRLEIPMIEAIARVLAPKRRVTCIPPDMRAATREARP